METCQSAASEGVFYTRGTVTPAVPRFFILFLQPFCSNPSPWLLTQKSRSLLYSMCSALILPD